MISILSGQGVFRMEIFNFLTLVASLLLLCGTDALLSPHTRLSRSLPSRSLLIPEVTWSSPTYNATFQQYIDHSNPALGTFSQRYWYNAEFWGGPGYPVRFSIPLIERVQQLQVDWPGSPPNR